MPRTLIGRILGHYRVAAVLGAGGMGEVYRASDTRLGRDVALKVLPAAMAGDPDRLERFRREARAVAALNHPRIVTIHSVEECDGIHFLTMELVEGRPLSDAIPAGGLPLGTVLSVGAALADALAAAHAKGIVHRDLKPANVMVGDAGRVKVLDFGLAKMEPSRDPASTESELPTATSAGVVMGTVPYMSPEQVQARPVDARTDLFSLGVILYEMATGLRPFAADSPAGLMTAILRDTPAPPSRLRAGLPAELDRVIARCLEKDPARRFPSAREAGDALAACGREPAASVSARAAPEPSARRRSIVVLPFTNLSPDRENEYFSDGLTEELIADLSKVRALDVISRTSAMRLKGTDKDVRTIGRELGVGYVLEGSVRKAGASVRITAQLVDASSDVHLWAEKYTGGVDDVFELQERVSREIVKALDVTLTSDEDRRLAQHPIADVKAFELFVRARNEMRGLGSGTERAQSLIRSAMLIEGETPPLRALLAKAKVAQVKTGINRDFGQLDEAEATAKDLLSRDPGAADGHALLAYIEYERGDLPLAVRHSLRALEREPNDADVLFYLVICYIAAGQTALARDTADLFVALDPLAPLSWMCAAAARWFTGEFEGAREKVAKGIELDPQNFMMRWTFGYTLAALGRRDEAAEQEAWLLKHGPTIPYTRQVVSLLRAMDGRNAEALAFVAPIDTAPLDAHNVFHLCESFAMAGETERALELLDAAVDRGFYPYPFIATHCPFLAPLRGLPRFAGIADKARRRVLEYEKATR